MLLEQKNINFQSNYLIKMKKLFFSLLVSVNIFNINAQGIFPSKDKTLVKEISLETSHHHVSKLVKDICFSNSINGFDHNDWRSMESIDLLKKDLMGLEQATVSDQKEKKDLKLLNELQLGQPLDQIHLNIRDYFGSEASVLQLETNRFIK